ncbi:MAG TPA: hypothetical protein VM682_00295, partial [Bacillus sp. (in: firmicutes)]|nr:hypothetical protein [Bacillus sp. (in: firmicutes)]
MKKSESVFIGASRSTQKKLYVSLLKEIREKYPKIHIPCVGTFALVDVALEAGYKPGDIFTSDISLMSSLLGALIQNQNVDEIGFRLTYDWQKEYDQYKTQFEKVAFLIWLMRGLDINHDLFYEALVYEYLTKSKEEIIADIVKQLKIKVEKYRGIHYSIKDLRVCIASDSPGTVTVVHPPAKGKSSDMGEIIFESNYESYNSAKEFSDGFTATEFKDKELWIWSCDRRPAISAKNIIFAEETGKSKFEYYCVTDPRLFEKHPLAYKIQYKSRKDVKSLGIEILPKSYE